MKHYKAGFEGEQPLDAIESAVGRDGGLVMRVHVDKGETHVYYAAGGESRGRHLGDLGAGAPSEVSEADVARL